MHNSRYQERCDTCWISLFWPKKWKRAGAAARYAEGGMGENCFVEGTTIQAEGIATEPADGRYAAGCLGRAPIRAARRKILSTSTECFRPILGPRGYRLHAETHSGGLLRAAARRNRVCVRLLAAASVHDNRSTTSLPQLSNPAKINRSRRKTHALGVTASPAATARLPGRHGRHRPDDVLRRVRLSQALGITN
jgi:hypothetical protein